MTKTLPNEELEDCSKVGLNPFCKLNPPPDAESDFWKKQYDHEATKKVRAAKKAAKKTAKKNKKKPSASSMFELNDSSESEDDTGASQAVEEEEASCSSSGDSSQTQLPAFKTAPGGQAKPSKKARVTKPAEDPKVHESEQQVPGSDASEKQPEEPAHEAPPEIPDLSPDHTDINPLNTESLSPLKPPEEHGEDNTAAQLQSQLDDAKTRLKNQESETRKADSKFQFSMAEKEKLKTDFEAERNAWAEEKMALTQRAKKVEAALQEVTAELAGLKHRVSQMVCAIFGKPPHQYQN
nr:neuromodulin-like [Aegilops tauschii subsp. strangulata]